MKFHAVLSSIFVFLSQMASAKEVGGVHIHMRPLYFQKTAPVEMRVDDVLSRMTLEEKVELLYGANDGMETRGVPRLQVPPIKMTDGPIGVRTGQATAFPASIAMASSFDPQLQRTVGGAMASETLAKGRDMLLGPCVNISRAPQGGRNFESYGEDPYLTSRMAEAWVQSVQAKGVISSTKHYAANDQEFQRMTIDVRVDERTLHEIHLPAFLAALKAGTWTVMSSYNRLNGPYASENKAVLTDLLKTKWGFQGFVVSDWTANHSVVESALAGLDLEMPIGEFWGNGKLLNAVRAGLVPESLIDDKVRRILRVTFASGTFDRQPSDRPSSSVVNHPAHRALALKAAHEGMVLLKNTGVLPLSADQRIAIIGPNAGVPRNNGGGSSRVVPFHDVSAVDGFRQRMTSGSIGYAVGVRGPNEFDAFPATTLSHGKGTKKVQGLWAEYFNNKNLKGKPVMSRVDSSIDFDWNNQAPDSSLPRDGYSIRWRGTYQATETGTFDLAVRSDDGVRVYFGGRLVLDSWIDQGGQTQRVPVRVQAGKAYDLKVEYYQNNGGAQIHVGLIPDEVELRRVDRMAALELAKQSDVVLLFVGSNETLEGEGRDRESLSLPVGQDELIEAVVAVNPKTVVIINGGGSVLMPWLAKVPAVVHAWYLGQEGGYAMADALLGKVNFSGKLPVSFYAREQDASSYGNFPGNGTVSYNEGIYVGYRHLDRLGIEPLFPFGHGLSYTQFQFDDLKVDTVNSAIDSPEVNVTARVTNIGARDGAEVLQLYVHPQDPKVDRPPQELKGFQKVWLAPGQSQIVTFTLKHGEFAHYDVASQTWRVDAGKFELRVGPSSRDLPLRGEIELHMEPL